MTISYKLYENDYLQYQLFEVSINNNLQRQKRICYIVLIIGILGIALYYQNSNISSIARFAIWAMELLAFLLYHFFSSWSKNHYKGVVKEYYKNCFGKTDTISNTPDHIESTNDTMEAKFVLSEIEGVFETGQYLFIKMKPGQAIIIPKMEIAKDFNALKEELVKITVELNIPFVLK
jgi:hypothetical protein